MNESRPAIRSPDSTAPRVILSSSAILSSWLLMQIVHEWGHLLGAWLTGGTVQKIVLTPWELSRTELIENPCPLFVSWAGPLTGAAFPLLTWIFARFLRHKVTFWLRFLAGFCLIANGAYIGVGAFTHDGDAGDILRDGCPAWVLLIFALITVPSGLALCHGLGEHFGFGVNPQPVGWIKALSSLFVLLSIVVLELALARAN